MKIKIVESGPSVEEYILLLQTTGWEGMLNRSEDELENVIQKSWYTVSAYSEENKIIGMGRIISDGVFQALICDLIVHPNYQHKKIGKTILEKLIQRCKEKQILMIQLFSAKDKAEFYKKNGFVERPADAPGMRYIGTEIES